MDLDKLAAKIQLLEDLEAIKTLKHRYCAYCDDNYNAEGIASLFVEDAIWDGGDFGRCVGREAIRKFFRGSAKVISLAAHQVMNPIIEVQGDHATGEWKLFQPCTLETKTGPRAMWLAATYRDQYIRTESGWLFQVLHVERLFFTPVKEGWVKLRNFTA